MNDVNLPPLPEVDRVLLESGTTGGHQVWFTRPEVVAAMQAYARAAVLAERERCAQICEQLLAFDEDNPGQAPADHIRLGAGPGGWIYDHSERAAAIRQGSDTTQEQQAQKAAVHKGIAGV